MHFLGWTTGVLAVAGTNFWFKQKKYGQDYGGKAMDDLIKRAAQDLLNSSYAIALTGAGMSTESGIPDFRGPDGIWTRDPEAETEAYKAYETFRNNPKKFWEERVDPNSAMGRMFEMLGELNNVLPNPGHFALAELEKIGILKSVLTQNVDTLHTKAGNMNVIEYHGAINKFRCIQCARRFSSKEIDLDNLISQSRLPPLCQCGGILKDDGVFFGEPIPEDVRYKSEEEALKCDAMLICGTSAVVYPFADLPTLAKFGVSRFSTSYSAKDRQKVTIIEVNAGPTPLTGTISDYLIQGKTGELLPRIVEEIKKIV